MNVYEQIGIEQVTDFCNDHDLVYWAASETQDFVAGLMAGIQHVRDNKNAILASGANPHERFWAAFQDAQLPTVDQRSYAPGALRAGMQLGITDELERGVTV